MLGHDIVLAYQRNRNTCCCGGLSMSVSKSGILVTGGGSGIGFGVAQRLAADGAHVTVCGRTEDTLAQAVTAITRAGGSANYAVADVVDEDAVAAAVDKAVEYAGRLDGVVTCAGGSDWVGPITQLPIEQWNSAFAVNVTGTMLVLKHSAAVMAESGGGAFVGISSIASSNTHRW